MPSIPTERDSPCIAAHGPASHCRSEDAVGTIQMLDDDKWSTSVAYGESRFGITLHKDVGRGN